MEYGVLNWQDCCGRIEETSQFIPSAFGLEQYVMVHCSVSFGLVSLCQSVSQSVSQSVTRLHVLRTGKLGTDKKMGEDLHSNVKYLVCFCLFSVVYSYFLFCAVRCMFAWLFIRGKVFCVYVMTAH